MVEHVAAVERRDRNQVEERQHQVEAHPVVRHVLQDPEATHERRHALAHQADCPEETGEQDRKSTRLNSSHSQISYAVFCLKKKKKKKIMMNNKDSKKRDSH